MIRPPAVILGVVAAGRITPGPAAIAPRVISEGWYNSVWPARRACEWRRTYQARLIQKDLLCSQKIDGGKIASYMKPVEIWLTG
jgi:hypothetical protein